MEASPKSPFSPPRYRFQNGGLYARDSLPYSHDIRVHELGHGHIEAVVTPHYGWHELDITPTAQADAQMAIDHVYDRLTGEWVPTPPLSPSELLDKLTCNRERSKRRASTKVRRLCKNKGLSVMLTLTYRENMLDRSRMARDFDVFVKRIRRVIPGFQYVCVFEKQKRGAWHAHIAVPRVLSHYLQKGRLIRSYDLLRSMWRGVVGTDNGNVDVSRNKRIARSAAKLASYLSKYISKGFGGGDDGGDSYRASGRALPPPVCIRTLSPQLGDAIAALTDLLQVDLDGRGEFHHALLDGGGYFVSISH